MVGVNKHLQTLILSQVQVLVLIDRLRLVLREVLHRKAQRLLVALCKLRLVGVGHSGDAWRQHISHRLTVCVFLYVDGTHLQHARLGSCRSHEVLLILSPLATHQVERAETQHDRLLESSQEHAHIANAGEVADRTDLIVIFSQWDAILIPAHGDRVAIAQLGGIVAMVHNMRLVRLDTSVIGLQLIVADGDMILIVAFVFVQGVVLIDILHIRSRLVRGVVALCLVVVRW